MKTETIQVATGNPTNNARKMCEEFKGEIFIHAVSTFEQNAVHSNIAVVKALFPNANTHLVTYDDYDALTIVEEVKNKYNGWTESTDLHVIVTTGLACVEGRTITSHMLTGIFERAGVKAAHSNYMAFRSIDAFASDVMKQM